MLSATLQQHLCWLVCVLGPALPVPRAARPPLLQFRVPIMFQTISTCTAVQLGRTQAPASRSCLGKYNQLSSTACCPCLFLSCVCRLKPQVAAMANTQIGAPRASPWRLVCTCTNNGVSFACRFKSEVAATAATRINPALKVRYLASLHEHSCSDQPHSYELPAPIWHPIGCLFMPALWAGPLPLPHRQQHLLLCTSSG